MSKTFILNFNVPRDLEDLVYRFEEYGQTNLDVLIQDFESKETCWSVPRYAEPGDLAVFMCAKGARDNLRMITSHLPNDINPKFSKFVAEQKKLYEKYSGYLLGFGVICSEPEHDEDSNWWFADIKQLQRFDNPIHISEFRGFIKIWQGSSTRLTEIQWEQLKWVIGTKNPAFASRQEIPDISLEELRKRAEERASTAITTTTQVKVYYRDKMISDYVKRRADGQCQLCGEEAPFKYPDGTPYLESHHIVPLSEGGMDSPDNCVALCPNCHKKMHVLNDPNDIRILKERIAQIESHE